MSKRPTTTLIFVALALNVLGCRHERTNREGTHAPNSSTPVRVEDDPPLIEDDDAIGEDDDVGHEREHDRGSMGETPPPAGESESSPVEPDMPETADPRADPKQPPPPSRRGAAG